MLVKTITNMTDLKASKTPQNTYYRNKPIVSSKLSRMNFIFHELCLALACMIYTFNPPDNAFIRSCLKVANIVSVLIIIYHTLASSILYFHLNTTGD